MIPNCPPDGISLLAEMLKWDPSKRITATKILTHPYFANVELPEEISAEPLGNSNKTINPSSQIEQPSSTNNTAFS